MKRALCAALVVVLGTGVLDGCVTQSQPRESNETRADKGMQSYSGFQPPASDRQFVTDLRNGRKTGRVYSAHGIAHELMSLPEVQGCAVVVERGTAYVGVAEAKGHALTPAARQTMARKIRQMDKQIGRVYITSDPTSVQFLSGYADALEKGLPIARFQEQFPDVVRNTWPQGPQS
jgi:YhcN/YlaJ family sporulation lipoprotein